MGSKVLVVDDEQDLLDLMEIILGGEGYMVVTAANGQEAAALSLHIADLLQRLPEELLRELQQARENLQSLADDFDSLFASSEVGTAFLDRGLRLRKFSPMLARFFMARRAGCPVSVGRPPAAGRHRRAEEA